QRRTIFIQTEPTPNPDALKFLPNHRVLPEGISVPYIEYLNPRATIAPPHPSPLAAQLLAIDGVTAVFYGADFITVTKAADANWAHVRAEIFALITEAITSGAPLVVVKDGAEAAPAEEDSLAYNEDDSEVVGMIKELLETRIRPAIQEDGGDIEFRGFEDGVLKPKLIKRLAQSHEIHALRDKEGNEAKAKRVCMQKVKEHGLNMEILDAEFQMDWKKLTFYYFADAYINFNSLVTDLFKIYKTRIWMSAINPASFASPTLGIQAPSGIGPGAVGIQRAAQNPERRQQQPPAPQQQQQHEQQHASFTGANPAARGLPNTFSPSVGGDRGLPAPGSGYGQVPQSGYPYAHLGAVGNANRQTNMPYSAGVMPSLDTYSYPQSGDYAMRGRFQTPPQGSASHDSSISTLTPTGDWPAFQGLSLNTR
ncbi:hypothetical protein BN1708_011160, partial [Verticillium longisporum]